MDHYNHERLQASLSYLRPVDFYRGNPAVLLAGRNRPCHLFKQPECLIDE